MLDFYLSHLCQISFYSHPYPSNMEAFLKPFGPSWVFNPSEQKCFKRLFWLIWIFWVWRKFMLDLYPSHLGQMGFDSNLYPSNIQAFSWPFGPKWFFNPSEQNCFQRLFGLIWGFGLCVNSCWKVFWQVLPTFGAILGRNWGKNCSPLALQTKGDWLIYIYINRTFYFCCVLGINHLKILRLSNNHKNHKKTTICIWSIRASMTKQNPLP